jgi:glycosyltransferase involved in cell wall biosynthesis
MVSEPNNSSEQLNHSVELHNASGEGMPIKVSVIIPVYNAEKTIARAIDTVFNQKFDSYEIIAVDDGSTDSSFVILQSYGDRVRTQRQRNRGASAARNAGAAVAVGEYLAFLDADDEWLPDKLRKCVEALDAAPGAVLASSDILLSDGHQASPISGSPSLDDLLNQQDGSLRPSAAVVRRSAYIRCGGFSEEFHKGDFGEDTFLGLRLREEGEFIHIAEPLAVYHAGDSSVMWLKYWRGYRTLTRLVNERYGRRGKGVISSAHRWYASMLVVVALEHIRESRFSRGLVNLARAAAVSPAYVLECAFNKLKLSWR